MIRFGALAVSILGASAGKCPNVMSGSKSEGGGQSTTVDLINTMDEDLRTVWVDFSGREKEAGILPPGNTIHNTYVGHVFRVRTNDDFLVWEGRVSEDDGVMSIEACDELPKDRKVILYSEGREIEFEGLVDTSPFTCDGASKDWSCIKKYTKEEVAARDPFKFGFLKSEVRGSRKEHEYMDDDYKSHIPMIPKLTQGFLKLNMTDIMRDELLPFYEKWGPKAAKHEPIGGDYSNIHKVGMTKIDLDNHQGVRRVVVKEMQEVLQWWTQRRLKHTSTFGIRVYHRDAMLINHVDRADTHLASAVLQVGQESDEGWPLEVMLDDGTTLEVYLQPGEMVLYEGARLFHGRPMRFNGDKFANVFTHFSPTYWTGVGKPWTDPLTAESKDIQPTHDKHTEL